MYFRRNNSNIWHEEIPGSRWFKADLHVHTEYDRPLDPQDPQPNLDEYARSFLQGIIRSGIQVVGLTPHSPRYGDESPVWKIVDCWNDENDDDGIPFRDKIYGVFPGFDPCVNAGTKGLHLLLLFDPEIGRDRYLSLFDAIMDARFPWESGELRISQKSPKELFQCVDDVAKDARRGLIRAGITRTIDESNRHQAMDK